MYSRNQFLFHLFYTTDEGNYRLWKIRHTEKQCKQVVSLAKWISNKVFQCLQSPPPASTRSLQLPFVLFVTQNMCILLYLSLFKLLIQFVLYSLSKDRNAGLFLFHCKEMTNSKGQCRLTQFKGKLDKVQLIRFLRSQTLPKYVSISRVAGAECKKKLIIHLSELNAFLTKTRRIRALYKHALGSDLFMVRHCVMMYCVTVTISGLKALAAHCSHCVVSASYFLGMTLLSHWVLYLSSGHECMWPMKKMLPALDTVPVTKFAQYLALDLASHPKRVAILNVCLVVTSTYF